MTLRSSTLVLTLALTSLANAQDMVPDFAHDLNREVSELEPLGLKPSDQQIREVASMVDRPEALIAGIQLYRGKIRARKGDIVDAWFAMIPLGPPIEGARLAIAMNSADMIESCGVWGTEDFDADPTSRWALFLNALRGQSFPRLRNREIKFSAVEASVQKIGFESKANGQLAEVLIGIRRGMNQNTMLMGLINAQLEKGERLPTEWIDSMIDTMGALAEAGTVVKSVIGEDGAAGFTSQAIEALEFFEEAKELNTDFEPAELAEFFRPQFTRTGMCNTCHQSRSNGLEKTWRGALRNKLFQLGVPGGMMQVGFDIPIAVGDDGKISKEIGAAFRGAIMLMDRLKE